MKTNSSPGMDGLTAAFYQVAPTIFGECLCIVFNHHLQVGRLSQSQRQSAIVLLYKKGMRACPSTFQDAHISTAGGAQQAHSPRPEGICQGSLNASSCPVSV
ncbi:hypothetical protein Plhal304r1_c053g0137291 [Plasmopara halstedii]